MDEDGRDLGDATLEALRAGPPIENSCSRATDLAEAPALNTAQWPAPCTRSLLLRAKTGSLAGGGERRPGPNCSRQG